MWDLILKKEKKRNKWTYLQNRNILTDIENRLTVTKGEMWVGVGEGINQNLEMNKYTTVYWYKIDNQQGAIV